MSCPSTVHRLTLIVSVVVIIAASGTIACTRLSGEDDATAPLGVVVSSWFVSVENRTGTALVDGKIEIIPAGRAVVFTTSWSRMEISEKRDFTLNDFRGTDGTPFRRNVVRARRVKVTARDQAGKLYERIVPFE